MLWYRQPGWAHGFNFAGRKFIYCHSPARWLYPGDRTWVEEHRPRAAVAEDSRPYTDAVGSLGGSPLGGVRMANAERD